jgi:hexosaminidase
MHKAAGKTVTLAKPPHQNYNPGSSFALVNGIEGVKEFNDNQWTGYSGGTMEAVIDLGDSTEIAVLGLNTLGNKDQWIYPPKQVTFFISKDGKHFTEAGQRKTIEGKGIIKVRMRLKEPAKVRYVKVVAQAVGKIPEGAPGDGNPAWLFVDEIIVQ